MTTETKKNLAGYKQTEIGMIPVDWDVKKIGDIADVIGGGTPSTTIIKYWNGSINWFTPTEIGVEKYVYHSKRKITDGGLKNSSAKILNEGAVLLTSRAGIGDLSILKNKACTNQGFQSLVPKSQTDSEFLYYLMLTKKGDLLDKASGSTFLEISPNNVRSILVQFPQNPEQVAIATALSDTDALINKIGLLIEKKKTSSKV
jgi:type I restriction enzyme S subunit